MRLSPRVWLDQEEVDTAVAAEVMIKEARVMEATVGVADTEEEVVVVVDTVENKEVEPKVVVEVMTVVVVVVDTITVEDTEAVAAMEAVVVMVGDTEVEAEDTRIVEEVEEEDMVVTVEVSVTLWI